MDEATNPIISPKSAAFGEKSDRSHEEKSEIKTKNNRRKTIASNALKQDKMQKRSDES